MNNLYHRIPIGTRVSFKDDPFIYIISDYNNLHFCDDTCPQDHESGQCWPEPHMSVKREIGTFMPLSNLENIFDQPNHEGRPATNEEKMPERIY